jgi:hypothetical protein
MDPEMRPVFMRRALAALEAKEAHEAVCDAKS